MTFIIEEATREQVAKFLPDLIEKAFKSYEEFMSANIDTTPAGFSKHHMAGKVALAHVHLLLKTAQLIDVKIEGAEEMKKLLPESLEDMKKLKDGNFTDFESGS